MKKLLNIYTNWRIDILFLLFSLTLILLLSEADTMTAFITSKVLGTASALLFYHLYTRWNKSGFIDELTKEDPWGKGEPPQGRDDLRMKLIR